jgi:hypothetical protein
LALGRTAAAALLKIESHAAEWSDGGLNL